MLKNEKMIMLMQIIERGNDYIIYNVKGAELQEETVCHAEENGYIGDVMKDVFEPTEAGRQAALARDEEARPPRLGVVDPKIAFSLAPMTTVNFSLYDDYKFSLGGIITDREFSQRVKKWFLHIFALKLNKLYQE